MHLAKDANTCKYDLNATAKTICLNILRKAHFIYDAAFVQRKRRIRSQTDRRTDRETQSSLPCEQVVLIVLKISYQQAISRVDSRPKLERYLKRFCRRLICCEFFLSLKPVPTPCPDQCQADGKSCHSITKKVSSQSQCTSHALNQ